MAKAPVVPPAAAPTEVQTGTLLDVAERVQRLAQGYSAVIELGAALGSLGSLKQATDEAQRLHAAVHADVEAKRQELALVASEQEAAEKAVADATARAKTLEAQIEAEAKERARKMIADAQERALVVANAAEDERAAVLASTRQGVDAMLAEQLQAEKRVEVLRVDIKARDEELAILNEKIAAAKAAVADMLR